LTTTSEDGHQDDTMRHTPNPSTEQSVEQPEAKDLKLTSQNISIKQS